MQARRASLALRLLPVVLLAACSPPSTWLRSRAADFADAVPLSVSFGWGIHASVRATALVELGVSLAPASTIRWGYEDRTYHGVWGEYQVGLPWIFWMDGLEDLPPTPASETRWAVPLNYRWQSIRDAPSGEGVQADREPALRSWGRHPPMVRESLGALVVPQRRRWLEFADLGTELGEFEPVRRLGAPERATLWETRREARAAGPAWDLFEVDVHAAVVGVRVGVRPVEFLDFVLGLLLVDFLQDDLPAPIEYEPQPPARVPASPVEPPA